MLTSGPSVNPQFLVATCLVPMSEERNLERFPAKIMLNVIEPLVLPGRPRRRRGVSVRALIGAFDTRWWAVNSAREREASF